MREAEGTGTVSVGRAIRMLIGTSVATCFVALGATVLLGRSLRDFIAKTWTRPPSRRMWHDPRQELTREGESVPELRSETIPPEPPEAVAEGPNAVGRTGAENPQGSQHFTSSEEAQDIGASQDTLVRDFLADARAFFADHPEADTYQRVEEGVRKRAISVEGAIRIVMWPTDAAWSADPALDRTFRSTEVLSRADSELLDTRTPQERRPIGAAGDFADESGRSDAPALCHSNRSDGGT